MYKSDVHLDVTMLTGH